LVAKSNTFGGNLAATISGLPADATKEEVQKLTKASNISLGDPTFDVAEAVEKLRNKLATFGTLHSFDLLPTLPTETKILVYTRCQESSATEAVVKDLNTLPLDFLNDGKLSIDEVYTAKYTILPRQWADLYKEMEKIEAALGDTVLIRKPHGAEESLWLECGNRTGLVQAKKDIDCLMRGHHVVLDNSRSMRNWHTSTRTKELMAQVERATGAFLQVDERRGAVTVRAAEDAALLAVEELQTAFTSQASIGLSPMAPIFMTRSEIAPIEVCGICSTPVSDCALRASTCGHTFCYDCIRHYIIEAALPLNCPETTCAGILPISLIRLAVPDETEFDALLETAFLAHIRSHPADFAWCPTPDCWTIYRSGSEGDVLQCPNCQARICSACHSEMHDGFDCHERTEIEEDEEM